MSAPKAVDVIVVGGGISGLATAFGAQQRGASVEVLDAGERAGGVIRTVLRDGALCEAGPNSALDTTPRINELLDALGIRDERADASAVASTRFIVRGGKLLALPTSPGAFLTTPAFTLGAKLRLLREPFIAPAPPDAEESIAAFVRRRLGTELLDYAIDPFVSGVYAGDPEQISVPAAFPRLHALEQKYGSLIKGQIKGARERRRSAETAKNTAGSFSFRMGMQTITDALARAVGRVVTGVRVQQILRNADGTWTVTGTRDGAPVIHHARAVVVAVPAYAAAELVRELAPAATQGLAAIPYAAVASVASAYRRSDVGHSLAGFGFLVPKKERRQILGSLFSSSMFEGRAPAGTVLLTSFIGGRRNPALPAKPDAELAAIVHGELQALAGARGEPLWMNVTRWTHAIPQYNLGHRERLRRLEDAERALPGLFFCASYRGGVSVGDCIKSAHAMAETLTGHLGRAK
ncbi:MAG: protoporphyrinogen oxidase [Betaproteobacteria bacterium]|nr:protoporphyrinogen oxidase [Betaproteobacteria bacterium]